MKDLLTNFWEKLHSSFWFLPTTMAVLAVALAFGAVSLDRDAGGKFAQSVAYIWSGGAEGARSLLSTIAGSMITVAGTVFSITIVALTLASSQFGPRLLRNFVRDTGNQLVLGTFTATFLYCILVLRTVRSQQEGAFIPYMAITLGVVLAVASPGVLIYFIHHVSVSIQAEKLIARVGEELRSAIDVHFPPQDNDPAEAEQLREQFEMQLAGSRCRSVKSLKSGYIQSIDRKGLVMAASRSNTWLVVRCTPGDFVTAGSVLLEVWHREGSLDGGASGKEATRFFHLGQQRTEEQDVRYGARQLAEIASRALSPGVNDPYTAMGCVDWISSALARAAQRGASVNFLLGGDGAARVRQQEPDFASLCQATWEPLIAYGLDSAMVAQHMAEALQRVAREIKRPADAATLQSVATHLRQQTKRMLKDDARLEEILDSVDELHRRLGRVMEEITPASSSIAATRPA